MNKNNNKRKERGACVDSLLSVIVFFPWLDYLGASISPPLPLLSEWPLYVLCTC